MKKIVLMLLVITGLAVCANAQDTTRVKKTPEERAAQVGKMMQKKLKLTADQSTKIDAILLDRVKKVEALKGQKGARADRAKVMADADTQIEAILTPDQQKLYSDIKQKESMKRKGMGKHGAKSTPPPTSPAPAQ